MERNIWGLLIILAIALSVGGLVEIVPLFYLDNTMEHNKAPELVWQRKDGQTLNDHQPGDGMRPYKALELAGRDVYQREGCYLCHSQMIRPFRAETLRYGHYSVAGEFVYDHPFQWGSKRTGPDLHRVGGKYSDEWHRIHLNNPRDVVPESNMPAYPWLEKTLVNPADVAPRMKALRTVGVPYTDAQITAAADEVKGKTELDALIAYLQVMGRALK